MRHLAEQDNTLASNLAEERCERSEEVAAERTTRTDEIGRVEDRIKDLATGGLRLSTWSLVLLMVGATCASIPDGVAQALRVLTPFF